MLAIYPWKDFDPFEANERLGYTIKWIDIDDEKLDAFPSDLREIMKFRQDNDVCLDFEFGEDVKTPDSMQYVFNSASVILPRRFFLPICAMQYMNLDLKPTHVLPNIWPTKVLVGRFKLNADACCNADACLGVYTLPLPVGEYGYTFLPDRGIRLHIAPDKKRFMRVASGMALFGVRDRVIEGEAAAEDINPGHNYLNENEIWDAKLF